MGKKKYSVLIPLEVNPRPLDKEITAAYILADFFKTDVIFIPRENQKTPDYLINGIKWELKSPMGKGKYNIQHCLKDALQQSTYIVIDTRYSKQHMEKISHELQHQMNLTRKIDRLLMITKTGKAVEILRGK